MNALLIEQSFIGAKFTRQYNSGVTKWSGHSAS